jgi:hypothetical protein
MAKWLSFAGLVLTLIGLAIAFYLPGSGGSYWGWSEKMERAQRVCDIELSPVRS